ncbi:LysR family transcriptional regulator [Acinetobacter calcoaceticus]|uniref:LysR family transcriptional regulator n=1 Tax=Acinetobacter calcoaceticus TaxID=471 RepID=UPI0002D1101C|nr:LysR family transcriptional regulator [Acinetobacter calcoaceticus]ENU08611.1 hypothetical protein F997_02058 [Acinetobacter calcoaceticus NIPH 13]WNY29602.1 LysR family transcriptional regulator [Acinetobacter calcoaceticus]
MNNLKSVRVFCEVVESKSFSRAAKRLFISNSSVSKHIVLLEEKLNVSLFKRNTRTVELSTYGSYYYSQVKSIVNKLDGLNDNVRQSSLDYSGKIRISIPVSLGLLHISPLISDFLLKYKDIKIECILDDSNLDVIGGNFDFVIRTSKKLDDSNLIAKKIGSFKHILVASPNYLDKNGIPKDPNELKSHSLLLYSGIIEVRSLQFYDIEKGQYGYLNNLDYSMISDNSLMLKSASLKGLGITRIPDIYIIDELKTGKLINILSNYILPETSIYILYSNEKNIPTRVSLLINFIAEKFELLRKI